MSDGTAMRIAAGPMIVVAAEQHEPRPLLRDEAAPLMLSEAVRRALGMRLARWLVRNASERQIPGIWGWTLCRKRYADDAAERAFAAGARAVVQLGAGLDTLAHRVGSLASAKVYEVDLPGVVALKRTALIRAFGAVPEHIVFVPLDVAEDSLGGELVEADWAPQTKTLFLWEGGTQYLSRDAVERTLDFLGCARAGSLVALTYVRGDFLSGRESYGAGGFHRKNVRQKQLWKTGFEPEEIAGALARRGWRIVEDVGSQELAARYVAPSGRKLPLTGLERWALAEKTSLPGL
ncbi:methyltransferase [Segniliparus rotundus DSM 44985]|uniref:S-adenosyl-L-methionine-dependent methyltransferase n=1 Tax=Segniliparus rotundus (strain ATCC BAA-972 / CDC 1076 / CIP 108378 / DSM 44985 / JCM 13578) TaxID=640132 RepID=D6ZD86_SEGRD|nr:SAM-dependent methyltransferase [Segniliparus rotundus]ADG97150.1 methyltransferase [Segniliparus rotundus DSM 44985]